MSYIDMFRGFFMSEFFLQVINDNDYHLHLEVILIQCYECVVANYS